MKCHYCGYNGGHDPSCPKIGSVEGSISREIWQHGYDDGRRGKNYVALTFKAFKHLYEMGWERGLEDVRREKAATGSGGK